LASATRRTPPASEILRPDIAERRRVRVETRQPDMANMLERQVFIDETSLKTNLVKATGRAPVGKRLIDHAAVGHWHAQTLIAGLCLDRLVAPWGPGGATSRVSFDACVERVLALDLLRAQGNDLIFLPPCSPDLNPIEMAVSKLKTPIPKATARTCAALWRQAGDVRDLFQPKEYRNHFKAAGYRCNRRRYALAWISRRQTRRGSTLLGAPGSEACAARRPFAFDGSTVRVNVALKQDRRRTRAAAAA
jgi:hypothetical protein